MFTIDAFMMLCIVLGFLAIICAVCILAAHLIAYLIRRIIYLFTVLAPAARLELHRMGLI